VSKRACVFILLVVILGLPVPAMAGGGEEVVAVKAGTIWTGTGKAVTRGIVLIKAGKIEAIGKQEKVEIPTDARIIDLEDGVVLPGLVDPYSRLGLFSRTSASFFPRGGTSRFSNRSDANPTAELFVRQEVFQDLLEAGVTTLALIPGSGGGITGQVSVIRPRGKCASEMILKEGVLLRIAFGGGTSAKSGLKTLLDRAKSEQEKVDKARKRRADWEKREEKKRKKAEEKRKKAAKKKGASSSGEEKKTDKKKAVSRGPKVPELKANLAPIVKARTGKLRVLLEISGQTVMDHFFEVLADRHELDIILVTDGRTAVETEDMLKEKKIPVLLTPGLATQRNTRVRINPSAILEKAGIEFAFRPASDRLSSIRSIFFDLANLVKCGLSKQSAIKAVTLTPARWLGVGKEVGSLEKGKAANLICFNGDPLASPLAELEYVMLDGQVVHGAGASRLEEE